MEHRISYFIFFDTQGTRVELLTSLGDVLSWSDLLRTDSQA
jgi:hypothetical protein